MVDFRERLMLRWQYRSDSQSSMAPGNEEGEWQNEELEFVVMEVNSFFTFD